jgi:hypothetical protein
VKKQKMTSLSAYIQGRIKNKQNKKEEGEGDKLTCYTYRYACDRWWGEAEGVRNFACDGSKEEVIAEGKKTAMRVTGSDNCKIELLHTFYMVITLPEEPVGK